MLKAPCKDCVDRYLGCHDHCEKYKEFAADRKRIQDLNVKRRQTDCDYYEMRKYHIRKDYHR